VYKLVDCGTVSCVVRGCHVVRRDLLKVAKQSELVLLQKVWTNVLEQDILWFVRDLVGRKVRVSECVCA
jgi:hypothetical protein